MTKKNHMESAEKSVQVILDQIRAEAIEPAEKDAQEIVTKAEKTARETIERAEAEAEKIVAKAQKEAAKREKMMEASLKMASKQCIATLREELMHSVFSSQLATLVSEGMKNSGQIAKLIDALITSVQEKGVDIDTALVIGKALDKKCLIEEISKLGVKSLTEEKVFCGDFEGGFKITFVKEGYTIDVSDHAIQLLVGEFLAEDLREYLFKA